MQQIKRDPHHLIYASSYDRGLYYLLINWDKIRKEVPDATLSVFYGWSIFNYIHKNNPAMMAWKDKMKQLLKQEGIYEGGRIGHHQLEIEFMKSGIWSYPCSFEEIFCSTACRAQRAGAIPITVNSFALKETVRNGIKVDVDITDKEGQEEYIQSLIKAMKDEKWQLETREPMMKWAKDYFKWSNVAKDWDYLFKNKEKNEQKS